MINISFKNILLVINPDWKITTLQTYLKTKGLKAEIDSYNGLYTVTHIVEYDFEKTGKWEVVDFQYNYDDFDGRMRKIEATNNFGIEYFLYNRGLIDKLRGGKGI